jgi:hypothetical protein
MTSFPGSPRLMKGALVGIDVSDPLASLIVFQYNPETMTRKLEAQTIGGTGGAKAEALRLTGAPIETITIDVDIDATDQLEKGDPIATSLGIYPQLSALEMLIYPKSAVVIANTISLLTVGSIEVVPSLAPFTLFVWGPKRVLPVRVNDFTITEEAYDVNLNPIRAKVSLGLRVLSYNDLSVLDPGYFVFLAHQVVKEAMAVVGSLNAAAAAGVSASFNFKLGG